MRADGERNHGVALDIEDRPQIDLDFDGMAVRFMMADSR